MTFALLGPGERKFINTLSERRIMNEFFFGEKNTGWEFIYVKPSQSAEDFEVVPLVLLRVLWGQQSVCVTRVSLSVPHQQNPEDQGSQPKITHSIKAAAIIPVRFILTRLFLSFHFSFFKRRP